MFFYLSSNFRNLLQIFTVPHAEIFCSFWINIVKTKMEQILQKTFWNTTKGSKGSNNNGDDNKLIITMHYLDVSDKWCIIVQIFINFSRNVYICGAAYFNDCAYFFLLIPYNDIWFVMRYFYCCLYWNIPPIFCCSLYKHIQSPFDV